MDDFPLAVAPCDGGWCIGIEQKDGQFSPMTFPWETKEEAEQFLQIARPDLDFVPSRLP